MVAAALAALAAAGVWRWKPWHTVTETVQSAPLPPAVIPSLAKARHEGRVIARVGDIELTNFDLARYKKLRGISFGVISDRQALDELCHRTLLNLAAAEHHLALTQSELEQALWRRKVIIAARAAKSSGLRAPDTSAPDSLINQVEQIFASSGLSLMDFQSEVRTEAIAERAEQALVYDQIQISNWELRAMIAEERRTFATTRMPWGRHSKQDAALTWLDAGSAERLRERRRHERGAEQLRALLKELSEKWKVELVEDEFLY